MKFTSEYMCRIVKLFLWPGMQTNSKYMAVFLLFLNLAFSFFFFFLCSNLWKASGFRTKTRVFPVYTHFVALRMRRQLCKNSLEYWALLPGPLNKNPEPVLTKVNIQVHGIWQGAHRSSVLIGTPDSQPLLQAGYCPRCNLLTEFM